MTPIDYAIVVGFLAIMAVIGLAISRLIKDSDDIFVAGRELTPFILCATITSTNLSMYHFIGLGGIAYQSGASIIWANWTGGMALVLSACFVVPVFRRLKIRSVPEFLEIRYSKNLRTLAGAFWGCRLCVYLGILLYIASTAAIVITGCQDNLTNYVRWLLAFSVVSILYSAIGGAWAVAIMDSVQFCVMLAGALVVLPIAAHAVGGMPKAFEFFHSLPGDTHTQLVPVTGEFNWIYISMVMLLSIKWATVDQAILQRAFGARSPRVAAKGMVLSAIITTPIALFWILPGLAAARLHPGFARPDYAMPWLLATLLPPVGRGILGFVLCGLIAAQISAVTADVNSVATLFTSDVYRSLRKKELSQKHIVRVVRISSVACGVLMLYVAYMLRGFGDGAVRANYAVVGILDMPLFVVTVIYGLWWKRANWQGATAGFLLGGIVGILTHFLVVDKYFVSYVQPLLNHLPGGFAATIKNFHELVRPHEVQVRNVVPFISTATALIVTPVVSLLTRKPQNDAAGLAQAFDGGAEAGDTYWVMPQSGIGKFAVSAVIIGVAIFAIGVISANWAFAGATTLAVAGMIAVFFGGMVRVYSE
ncbi:MAG TPA: sodium:solute symporter family protein [Tepidisphaeraceae bacterium]|jgi:SSS family solute:Na+ symporter|nr:sodium:solute symporter family protein [Tepidisphaeraceae bacterium]